MLLSHLKRFIYLKTVKTAGTTIEVYFERYCVPPGSYEGERHVTAAAITPSGIIGSRGPDQRHRVWHNHMPAKRVRELVGEDIWTSYFKFCAVRNPFDKVVSHFWFELQPDARECLRMAPFDEVRLTFGRWVRHAQLPLDSRVYCIDGISAVDDVVRYEHLVTDLERICVRLGLPWEGQRLGHYKSDRRVRREPFQSYYDRDAEDLVANCYRWEIERFGYAQPCQNESGLQTHMG
jgi:hypothetical protein